jgi:hypothetical protein
MKAESPVWRFSTVNPQDEGSVLRNRLQTRTRELARLAGRVPPYVVQADYEQAKRDVSGESDSERQSALVDSMSGCFPEIV